MIRKLIYHQIGQAIVAMDLRRILVNPARLRWVVR